MRIAVIVNRASPSDGGAASVPGLMRRPPRDAGARIAFVGLGLRLTVASLLMAGLALGVVA